jgi:hypothetical protein
MTTDLNSLRNQLADRLDLHPVREWSPALIAAFIAMMDVHFEVGGTTNAPVLQLVGRGDR